jgi:hypothetical protein
MRFGSLVSPSAGVWALQVLDAQLWESSLYDLRLPFAFAGGGMTFDTPHSEKSAVQPANTLAPIDHSEPMPTWTPTTTTIAWSWEKDTSDTSWWQNGDYWSSYTQWSHQEMSGYHSDSPWWSTDSTHVGASWGYTSTFGGPGFSWTTSHSESNSMDTWNGHVPTYGSSIPTAPANFELDLTHDTFDFASYLNGKSADVYVAGHHDELHIDANTSPWGNSTTVELLVHDFDSAYHSEPGLSYGSSHTATEHSVLSVSQQDFFGWDLGKG